MKDNFSSNASDYARFRPEYPGAFFTWMQSMLSPDAVVWDAGTGNGQVAKKIAGFCKHVEATDISEQQLANAVKAENINYSVQPAEKTDFPSSYFDCVIVAQAIHWFDFEAFYTELKRTAKPGALFIVLGYGLIKAPAEIQKLIDDLYYNRLNGFWDRERKYLDENYTTISFPFEEISVPAFRSKFSWSADNLSGYLETWSAITHYKQKTGINPIEEFDGKLRTQVVNNHLFEVEFPILVRAARI